MIFSLVIDRPLLPRPFELFGVFEDNGPRCEEGGVLEGSPLLFCDGSRWNGTAPQCMRESPFYHSFSLMTHSREIFNYCSHSSTKLIA